jgi:hypothetical protein
MAAFAALHITIPQHNRRDNGPSDPKENFADESSKQCGDSKVGFSALTLSQQMKLITRDLHKFYSLSNSQRNNKVTQPDCRRTETPHPQRRK